VSDGQSNTIGGAAAGAGNIISGNAGNGVHISANNASTSETVAGNKIGVDANFHLLANNRSGVFIDGAGGNTIGGVAAGAANVISGNGVEGVLLAGNCATGNTALGNFIGTDPNDDELPNGDAGVYINAVPRNVIGGPDGAGEAGQNVIRYNANAGVQIDGRPHRHRLGGNPGRRREHDPVHLAIERESRPFGRAPCAGGYRLPRIHRRGS